MVDVANVNKLAEVAQWIEDLAQLEDGWWPTGGPVDPENNSGIMNWQAYQLGSRTLWLRDMLAGIGGEVNTVTNLNTLTATGFYGIGTNAIGHPQAGQTASVCHVDTENGAMQIAVTADGKFKFRVRNAAGAWGSWATLFNTNVQGSGSGIDADMVDGKHYSDIINDIMSTIVDTAPGTLDTLNELAAALGDDPNFATTMTNALAGKLDVGAKAADSDLLDGLDSTQFVRADANDYMSGTYYFNASSDNPIRIGYGAPADNNTYISLFRGGTVRKGYWQALADRIRINNDDGLMLDLLDTGTMNVNGAKVWTSANDGSGTGLDADLLDGLHATSFLRSDASDTGTGTYTLTKIHVNGQIESATGAAAQVNGFMRSGALYIHEHTNDDVQQAPLSGTGKSKGLLNSGGNLHWGSFSNPIWDAANVPWRNAPTHAQELGANVNLNTITEPGFYVQSINADALSGTNYPPGQWAGTLLVQANAPGSILSQTYTDYRPSHPWVWVRTYYGTTGEWSSWHRQAVTYANHADNSAATIVGYHEHNSHDDVSTTSTSDYAAAAGVDWVVQGQDIIGMSSVANGTKLIINGWMWLSTNNTETIDNADLGHQAVLKYFKESTSTWEAIGFGAQHLITNIDITNSTFRTQIYLQAVAYQSHKRANGAWRIRPFFNTVYAGATTTASVIMLQGWEVNY